MGNKWSRGNRTEQESNPVTANAHKRKGHDPKVDDVSKRTRTVLADLHALCPHQLLSEVRPEHSSPDTWDTIGGQLIDLDRLCHVPRDAAQTQRIAELVQEFVSCIVEECSQSPIVSKLYKWFKDGYTIATSGSFPLDVKVGDINEFDFQLIADFNPENQAIELMLKNQFFMVLQNVANKYVSDIHQYSGPATCMTVRWVCPEGHQHVIDMDLTLAMPIKDQTPHSYISNLSTDLKGSVFERLLDMDLVNSHPFVMTLYPMMEYLGMLDYILLGICREVSPLTLTVYRVMKVLRDVYMPDRIKKTRRSSSPSLSSHQLKQLLYWEVHDHPSPGDWEVGAITARICGMLRRAIRATEAEPVREILTRKSIIEFMNPIDKVMIKKLINVISDEDITTHAESASSRDVTHCPDDQDVVYWNVYNRNAFKQRDGSESLLHRSTKKAVLEIPSRTLTELLLHRGIISPYPNVSEFPLVSQYPRALSCLGKSHQGIDYTKELECPTHLFLVWAMYNNLQTITYNDIVHGCYRKYLDVLIDCVNKADVQLGTLSGSLSYSNNSSLSWIQTKVYHFNDIKEELVKQLRIPTRAFRAGNVFSLCQILTDLKFQELVHEEDNQVLFWLLVKSYKLLSENDVKSGRCRKILKHFGDILCEADLDLNTSFIDFMFQVMKYDMHYSYYSPLASTEPADLFRTLISTRHKWMVSTEPGDPPMSDEAKMTYNTVCTMIHILLDCDFQEVAPLFSDQYTAWFMSRRLKLVTTSGLKQGLHERFLEKCQIILQEEKAMISECAILDSLRKESHDSLQQICTAEEIMQVGLECKLRECLIHLWKIVHGTEENEELSKRCCRFYSTASVWFCHECSTDTTEEESAIFWIVWKKLQIKSKDNDSYENMKANILSGFKDLMSKYELSPMQLIRVLYLGYRNNDRHDTELEDVEFNAIASADLCQFDSSDTISYSPLRLVSVEITKPCVYIYRDFIGLI